jgi:Pyruvate/2-oxoacid:ferredoxin oxidoreductase delta subunit
LGIYRLEQIDIAGEPIQKLANKNFSVSRKKYTLQQGSMALLSSIISRRPVIKKKLCTRCGICIATCPVTPKALSWPKKKKKRPPEYHYQYCIRCFCCQENCPQKAIEIKRPLPGKIISLFF